MARSIPAMVEGIRLAKYQEYRQAHFGHKTMIYAANLQ
jgi:hypothetical protein